MKLSEVKSTNSKKLSPLFKLERNLNYKALIIFSLVAGILLFINIALFPMMDSVLKGMAKYFEGNPELQEVVESLGNMSIGTYFSAQASQAWVFIGAIYAGFLGCRLINSNFKDGSYEMLYTQNISRTKIVVNKLLRLVINVVLFNLVCAIFGIVSLAIWGKGQFQFLNFFGYFIFAVVATLQVGVFSFALALLGRRKYTTLLSVLVAVVFYIFANIASGGSSLQFIEYFTPLAVSFADVVGSGFKVVNYYSFAIWFVVPAVLLFFGIKNYKNTDLI